MAEMNDLVTTYMERMKEFIDELAVRSTKKMIVHLDQNPTLSLNMSPTKPSTPIHLEKELASLYHHCKENLSKMYEIAQDAEVCVVSCNLIVWVGELHK